LEPNRKRQRIEHTANAVFVAFWLVHLEKEGFSTVQLKTYNSVVFKNLQHKNFYSFQNLSKISKFSQNKILFLNKRKSERRNLVLAKISENKVSGSCFEFGVESWERDCSRSIYIVRYILGASSSVGSEPIKLSTFISYQCHFSQISQTLFNLLSQESKVFTLKFKQSTQCIKSSTSQVMFSFYATS